MAPGASTALWDTVKKKRRRKSRAEVVQIDVQEIDALIDATASAPLTSEQRERLRTIIHLLIEQIDPRFRTSEKLSKLLEEALADPAEAAPPDKPAEQPKEKRKPGNGRNGAAKFTGAKKVLVPHQELKPGDTCPGCERGKVYRKKTPKRILRFTGMAPVQATVYELEQLRCNLCGETFTAAAPEGIGSEKYDESVPSILAVLIYGSGFPRYRLEGLQESSGIPLPQSTQWDLLNQAAKSVAPAHSELVRQAAQGDILHSDDTTRKILKLERPPDDIRTGIFTSGIVSTAARDGPRIALFFTGRQHAGENLSDVLQHRAEELSQPTHMSDALSRNTPKQDGAPMDVDPASCLAHGRRHVVDNFENFPDECGYVLDEFAIVFGNEKKSKAAGLDPQQRLKFHQAESGPVMERLHGWLESQLDGAVEPNSGLGKAFKYLLNHWEKLTLFLRKAGAPLENNICERALKRVVLHRKNALFFRTTRGAEVGDIFTSIVHTCELNGVNAFEYLKQLLRHSAEVRENPGKWMPWNCPGLEHAG